MILFEHDAYYLEWLARHRTGFVVNVRRNFNRNYVVLHRATCWTISCRRNYGAYTERSYRKICGESLDEVQAAPTKCDRPRGDFTRICTICNPLN